LAFDDDTYTIGETSTLPYAVRLVEPAEIHVFLKLQAGLFVAGLPQHDTEALRSTLHEVYPSVEPAERLADHAAERQPGDPSLRSRCSTPGSSIAPAATSRSTRRGHRGCRQAHRGPGQGAARARRGLGGAVLSEPALGVRQGYMLEENYSTGYSTAPGFPASGPSPSSTTAT
jgi:opine dehydrogenase